jgi:hypothetical protein
MARNYRKKNIQIPFSQGRKLAKTLREGANNGGKDAEDNQDSSEEDGSGSQTKENRTKENQKSKENAVDFHIIPNATHNDMLDRSDFIKHTLGFIE